MNYLLNYGLSTNEIEAIEKNNMTLLGIAIEEQENVIKNIEYFKSLEININFYILNRFLSLFTQDNEELIKKYGAQAYYNSPEGRIVEQTIDSYGAAYLRAAATTLGYSYNTPNFNIRESNQTEI